MWHVALLCWVTSPKHSGRVVLLNTLQMAICMVTLSQRTAYVKEAILDLRLAQRVMLRSALDLPRLHHDFKDFITFLMLLCEEEAMRLARAEVVIMPEAIMAAIRHQICSGDSKGMSRTLFGCVHLVR